MTGSGPPPGWYPDPADDQQLRWWTGERWTGAARPLETDPGIGTVEPLAAREQTPQPTAVSTPDPASMSGDTSHETATTAVGMQPGWGDEGSAGHGDGATATGLAAWPRERMIAATAIGGLLLASLALWLFAVVLTGSGDRVTVSDADPGDSEAAEEAEETSPDDGSSDAGAAGSGDLDVEVEDGDAGEEAPDGDRTVDFDGECTVELDAAEAEGTQLRPWQFAECEAAPINLDGGDGRWIVVIASVDGDLDADEARDLADGHGSDYGLLWSSHYPSLNPGWWVVFDGPFTQEDDAAEVAEDIGSGAYPRMLSDDEGDRYCIAEDGC